MTPAISGRMRNRMARLVEDWKKSSMSSPKGIAETDGRISQCEAGVNSIFMWLQCLCVTASRAVGISLDREAIDIVIVEKELAAPLFDVATFLGV